LTIESTELARKHWVIQNVENHPMITLKKLFVEEKVALHINSYCTSLDEALTSIILVQISNEGKLHFISCTAQTVNKSISDHYALI